MASLTFGSLFAGIGGIDLGFERAGLKCKWQVEIDDYARRVLAKHWPDVRRFTDIREFPPRPIAPELRVDVIAGGFPCQDISYAGKGAGLAGERSGLFFELARVVREMGPRYVVLENVAALLSRGMGEVLGTLASLGFDAEWHCIPAAALGAPHIRDRVFILGHAADADRGPCPQKGPPGQEQAEQPGRTIGGTQILADTHGKGLQRQRPKPGRVSEKLNDAGNVRRWETEPAVGRVADGVPNRVDRLRGLGNAVVPQVAQYVAEMVLSMEEQRG